MVYSHLATPPCDHKQLFDFETAHQVSCFRSNPPSSATVTLAIDNATVKHGTKSLNWTTTAASILELKSTPGSTFEIPNSWLRRGGVQVWFYKTAPSPAGRSLQVKFKHATTIVGAFQANLDFQGWRAIWIKFDECKLSNTSLSGRRRVIDTVNFVLSNADTIYMDLLKFKKEFGKQSRDKIVPPISPFGLELYDESHTWQQTYYWSQQSVPSLPSSIDLQKNRSLEFIKSRLKNWYCDETKTSFVFPRSSFLEKRWKSHLKKFTKAHGEYDKLNLQVHSGKIVGPPLFCRNSGYQKKFGFIMTKILLPLALEYYLKSRTNEIADAARTQLPELNSGSLVRQNNAYKVIAGGNRNMQRTIKNYLPSSSAPFTTTNVETAINRLNVERLNKINNLLDFAKEQGFADGSGLGSLNHEMNMDGAGFMHTLFLISDSLNKPSNKSRFLDLINTAKWYNDFREIYQSPAFEIKGTTADRMITLMLFRLMIVLVMPSDTDDEVKAKLRDMEALVRWMNNALAVNEGLGGVMKPDYTGHHHKAFYGSAYVPQALHNAALVQYLLGGTEFSLSTTSVNNIRRGLETLRLIAVKYSTPNSVNGRFPNYTNKLILKAVLPGYAYISVSHPSSLPSTIPMGISVTNVTGPEMFLRLYSHPTVDSYLEEGSHKGKYYFNTLGSLDIMEAVSTFPFLFVVLNWFHTRKLSSSFVLTCSCVKGQQGYFPFDQICRKKKTGEEMNGTEMV